MTFVKKNLLWLLGAAMCCGAIVHAQDESFTMTQIGTNNLLTKPWDLQYGPDDYLWITERESGIISRVHPQTGEKDVLVQIADVYADGGQDGLLGIALHPELLGDSAYVYVSYTRLFRGQRRQRIARYTYQLNGTDGSLTNPIVLVENMPGSNDHNSGRLVFGLDGKLYYSIGDQGVKNCDTNLAQFLPSQADVDAENWSDYPGKILRINTDGSIPDDNPVINGVQSHVFSYGHRNPQGLVMSKGGKLYSDEHGPSSDDEANLIVAGKNYGWPFVAGIKDNLSYDNNDCLTEETSFDDPNYQDPLMSLFTPDYDIGKPCSDNWMCRPNIAPSSIDVYEGTAIPGWENSLLLTSLKRGRVYRLKLNETGDAVVGDVSEHFYTQNRYRDIAISPDGKSIYIITDESGNTSDSSGFIRANGIVNPGVILKFTYEGATAVGKIQQKSPVQVYPNPVADFVTLHLQNNDAKAFTVRIVNTKGQEVVGRLPLQTGDNTLNLEHLPTGVYMVVVQDSHNSWHQRIVRY